MTVRVITLRLPDPSALTWEHRADVRNTIADAVREATGVQEPVGVDLVPDEPVAEQVRAAFEAGRMAEREAADERMYGAAPQQRDRSEMPPLKTRR